MAISLARTGVVALTLSLAATPASAEPAPPAMLAGGLALIADQSVNGQLELRYARPIRRNHWWSSTAAVGNPVLLDPTGMNGHGGWVAEARTGLLIRACNDTVCGGLSAGLGAQHRRVSFDAQAIGDPAFDHAAYQNRQTSVLGDARLHAQLNWDDDGRAGLELTFGFRYHHIVSEHDTPMPPGDRTRSPAIAGVVLGAGIVGSL